MTQNTINVTASTGVPIKVNVTASESQGAVTLSQDTSAYNAEIAKQWAISDNKVLQEDYSSKYYATKAKDSENSAKNYANVAETAYNNIQDSANGVIADIETSRVDAVDNITTVKSESIASVEAKGNEVLSTVNAGIAEINSTKTTILQDIEFVADGEKEEIRDIIDTGKDELKEAIGDVKVLTTLKIGQIGIAPLGIDETLNLERYLNGQIIIQDQFKVFTAFLKKRVALYPSIACLEEEWQTIVANSAFSQCGKFVIDDNAGTIRLPKVVNIQGLTDLSKLGEIVEAGLPNITGSIDWVLSYSGGASGAFYNSGNENGNTGANYQVGRNYKFDASRSNSIYGNSNTVQQEQIQYPYFIQVATGAEIEDNIINEIELNIPYSLGDSKYSPKTLNNLSWLKSEGQWISKAVYPAYYDWALTNFNNGVEGFALSTGEYTDYDVVINSAEETFRLPLLDGSEDLPSNRYDELELLTSDSTYTAPANGWFYVNKQAGEAGKYLNLYNITSGITHNSHPSTASYSTRLSIVARKGDIVKVEYTLTGVTNTFRFVYAQGNGSLYFYVGETVQNANLINAGRIEEKITSLLPNNSNLITDYCTPDWSKKVSKSLNTTYTAEAGGLLVIRSDGGGIGATIKVNDTIVAFSGTSSRATCTCNCIVAKGDTYRFEQVSGAEFQYAYFIPLKGAK